MGKMKNKKNIARAALSAVMALTIAAAPVLSFDMSAMAATDYDAKIAELEKKQEQLKAENERREQEIDGLHGDIAQNDYMMDLINEQIAGYTDEIDSYSDMITEMQVNISNKEAEISIVEKAIKQKEIDIDEKYDQIAELEAENEENLDRFAELIRTLYMNDTSDTLPILDGSDDWYDFFTYVDVVQDISKQNMQFMTDLLDDIHTQEDLIESINGDIAELNDDKSELQDKKAQIEADMGALREKKAEAQQLSDERYDKLNEYAKYNESLEWQISSLRSETQDYEEEIAKLNDEIEELIRAKQAELAGGYDYSSDGFRWPLDTKYQLLTTYFGYDAWRGGYHYGIDVGNYGIGGANIYAAQSGTVITAFNDGGWHGGYGNYVIIDHGGGLSTLYAHCRSTTVSVGQWVNKGEVIGYVGTTGWSSGNHLHFETRVNGVAQNPFNYTYEYV